ncbi:GNAT family N-acetyltransferase [Clostridium manihotivorum]|uniref:GNAT family N-acetyltransferase n=1 Tax=Clostridium manihotivorum TaxID=2320868 RepID=A0A3R5V557_9CLOT|nr:GNAT family N-acetyltransferase [Clostridium manihotivorum]QAA30475.1 GNAT family N-acetyltransferase [Clostridium manihotivorum]
MLTISKALTEDAEALTSISTTSFNHDSKTYLGKEIGPYGYNLVEWHLDRMDKSDYYKILNDNNIIGGIYVSKVSDSHYQLQCIFIHPQYQNKKIGTKVIDMIEESYPSAEKWTLDTPSWNPRTNNFYKKLGYTKIGEEDLKFLILNLYEKVV